MGTTPASTPPSATSAKPFAPSILSAYPESIYRGFLGWPDPASRNKECVHLAKCDTGDGDFECYVKLYPSERGQSRGLANEIAGYLLLAAAGVPQPPTAFLARIPVDRLLSPPQAWVRALQGTGRSYWGFGCEKLPGRTAALHFASVASNLLREDMENWPALPLALAADEHLAHTDRHYNNVVRIASGQYAMIDNGRLIAEGTQRNWKRSDLQCKRLYRHRLSEHLWNHRPPAHIGSDAMRQAAARATRFEIVENELQYWLELLGLPKVDRLAWIDFLSRRAHLLEDLLKQRFGLLL